MSGHCRQRTRPSPPSPTADCPLAGAFPPHCEARFAAVEARQRDASDRLDWIADHVEILVRAAGGVCRPRPRTKK